MSQANDTKNCTKDDTNVHKELTERQREIISFVKEDCTITSQKIAQKISQKNRATTRTIIADMFLLQQMGYLRREGGRKKGKWVIENKK